MIRRLAAAASTSLALHGAALAGLSALPYALGRLDTGLPGGRMLNVTLKEAARPAPPPLAGEPQTMKAAVPAAGPARRAMPGPVYYRLSELDERPRVRVHVEPRFPALAPVPEGRVRLDLFVGEDGAVERLEVTGAEPAGVFEQAALDAFAAARFTPGKKGGLPVKSRLGIEVLFGLPAPLTQEAAAFAAPR